MQTRSLLPQLNQKTENLVNEFSKISDDRKSALADLTKFVQERTRNHRPSALTFICTHNSRRSHISQIWAQAAATFYGIDNVNCYSGGTEATAFNPRAVNAMIDAGFTITVTKPGDNPIYAVTFSDSVAPLTIFSKRYDDTVNPSKDFAAVMTCSHADQNCPVVTGAAKRISLPYDDPKDFDGTPLETQKYAERVDEIGREILFAFSNIKR
jgi:arsenate reductase (thioredoxin)